MALCLYSSLGVRVICMQLQAENRTIVRDCADRPDITDELVIMRCSANDLDSDLLGHDQIFASDTLQFSTISKKKLIENCGVQMQASSNFHNRLLEVTRLVRMNMCPAIFARFPSYKSLKLNLSKARPYCIA